MSFDAAAPVLIGRSSSSFTRVARIFAAELQVDYSFRVLPDLLSTEAADYGGNPALKIPTLQTADGVWFGALNICRELWRRSSARPRVVWPEDLTGAVAANAQELVLHAMATEVGVVMSRVGGASDGGGYPAKMQLSLTNTMAWLEANAPAVIAALPQERDLSFLEVALFCLVTHLQFRDVLPTAPYAKLVEFSRRFATRASAMATEYRFDAAAAPAPAGPVRAKS